MSSPRPQIALTQVQRLALNTSLHAAIKVLRQDAAGLTRYLEEQAAANPHLRLDHEPPATGDWLPRWTGVFAAAGSGNAAEMAEGGPSLIAHVLTAVDAMGLAPQETGIALAIVEELQPSGWIGAPLPQIAAGAGVGLDAAEAMLTRLQTIEPAGLFARDLAECLRLQAAEIGALDAAMTAVLANLDLLARGDPAQLARRCKITETRVAEIFAIIRAMNPKPGSGFAPVAAAALREPDLTVRHGPEGWVVALNRAALPRVRVLAQAAGATAAGLGSAKTLQKMVEARNSTLLRVAQEIVRRQGEALELGPIALRPMAMADLAAALDCHESTISRVVAGAGLDGPRGTWWLRQMFSPALGGDGAPVLSAAAMRARLARAVAGEVPSRPLSDAALAQMLHRETGIALARRTVAKYREMQGIPPAHRRKRLKLRAATPRSDRKGRVQG